MKYEQFAREWGDDLFDHLNNWVKWSLIDRVITHLRNTLEFKSIYHKGYEVDVNAMIHDLLKNEEIKSYKGFEIDVINACIANIGKAELLKHIPQMYADYRKDHHIFQDELETEYPYYDDRHVKLVIQILEDYQAE